MDGFTDGVKLRKDTSAKAIAWAATLAGDFDPFDPTWNDLAQHGGEKALALFAEKLRAEVEEGTFARPPSSSPEHDTGYVAAMYGCNYDGAAGVSESFMAGWRDGKKRRDEFDLCRGFYAALNNGLSGGNEKYDEGYAAGAAMRASLSADSWPLLSEFCRRHGEQGVVNRLRDYAQVENYVKGLAFMTTGPISEAMARGGWRAEPPTLGAVSWHPSSDGGTGQNRG